MQFGVEYLGKDNDDYINGGGFCCDDGLRSGAIGNGNDNPELFQYYYHSDHLGSSSLITNLDGDVVQHVEYVPFGEVFIEERNNKWNTPYLFNAKELDEETGLYYYGARYYNPREAVWLSADPLQEKYPNVSTYAYCGNKPVKFVDPDGREISFSYKWEKDKDGNYVKNANGGYNLIGVTMNVTGKVINISSNSEIDMQAATDRIANQISSSFNGNVEGISFSTNVNLSVVNSMDDVADSDHVFALADMGSLATLEGNRTPNGVSNMQGGKVAFIDVDYFSGLWDTSWGNKGPQTAAHEFGHLLNLYHTKGGLNLMISGAGNSWGAWGATKITNTQLKSIHVSYKNGALNRGSNYELFPYYNWTTKETKMRKMPNRKDAIPVIKY